MPNSHIIFSLNSYIENPDPRYALMLKGKWGCGKTFLVNRWIEETFKNPENKDDVVLEPIRVSLYGMTETEREGILKYLIEGGELSRYGLSNAVTRASQDSESYDRATALESIGWKVITMPAGQWKEINASDNRHRKL